MKLKMEKETDEKIQSLQLLEHNLQQLLLQKQALQAELNETESALAELSKSEGAIYKIIGSVMLKSSKSNMEKELNEKNEVLALRMKNIEKQEKVLHSRVEEIRKDVLKELK